LKTIQMTIDDGLLRPVDEKSAARKTTCTALIREALEAEIRRQRIRDEDDCHVHGYLRHPVVSGESDVWLDCREPEEWYFTFQFGSNAHHDPGLALDGGEDHLPAALDDAATCAGTRRGVGHGPLGPRCVAVLDVLPSLMCCAQAHRLSL
jgi:hypothetical protein